MLVSMLVGQKAHSLNESAKGVKDKMAIDIVTNKKSNSCVTTRGNKIGHKDLD